MLPSCYFDAEPGDAVFYGFFSEIPGKKGKSEYRLCFSLKEVDSCVEHGFSISIDDAHVLCRKISIALDEWVTGRHKND